jgi:RimK family alpha-L-glutamate ligase
VRCIDALFSQHLESLGISVFNPSLVSEIANDKAQTHLFLARHHIPMTETYFIDKKHLKSELIPLAFPYVLKETAGRGGKNVHIVHSTEELQKLTESSGSRNWVVQKLAGTPGKDVRVFVVGCKIAGAVLRSSASDFRANFSLGGKAELYQLNDEERKLAEKIASLLPIGMVGIDFLFDEYGKFLFNEIEDVAGSRTLSACSDVNIVRLYLEHIMQTIKNPADR